MESLLRSTLTCLYNQTCIQQINAGNLSSIHSLNASLSNRFMPNTTVEEMFTNGFVERWSFNVSYSKFFSECAPSYCTYTESQKKNTLQIIAILLGLYGGLTLILRLVVPNCVALFNRLILLVKSKNNRIVPDSWKWKTNLIIIFYYQNPWTRIDRTDMIEPINSLNNYKSCMLFEQNLNCKPHLLNTAFFSHKNKYISH